MTADRLPPEAVELRLRLLYNWLLAPPDDEQGQVPVPATDTPADGSPDADGDQPRAPPATDEK